MITGITPSGDMTLGNYLAVVKKLLEYQNEYDLKVFIANLHAITMPQDPKELNERIKRMATLYFACGLDPKKATIFLQSDILEHTMLGWIFNTQATIGELERMTQYKDKSVRAKASNKTSYIPAGLLTYPTLMAADILLYDAVRIPVGQDQFQHLELTRNLAERWNNKFGKLFTVPKAITDKDVLKIMDLQEPTKKMSKSSANPKAIIKILDEPDVIRKKIASAITDSENIIKHDPKNKPGVSNLLVILKALTNKEFHELEKEFKDKNYRDLKESVAEALIQELEPIQKRYKELFHSNKVEKWLEEGANAVRPLAQKKLHQVIEKMGLNYKN